MGMNEIYVKRVIKAAELNWDRNQKKMESKGINKESYMLGYLHGYQLCFDTYELDQLDDIIKEYSRKEEGPKQ